MAGRGGVKGESIISASQETVKIQNKKTTIDEPGFSFKANVVGLRSATCPNLIIDELGDSSK